jgi:hypothetical protein
LAPNFDGHVYEGGKIGRSDATPNKLFFVDSFDMISMSYKFGDGIFITFEMPRVAYNRPRTSDYRWTEKQ